MVVWLSDVSICRLAHQYTALKLKNNWHIPHINIATSNNTVVGYHSRHLFLSYITDTYFNPETQKNTKKHKST
jgi:hypothetical protein